MRNSIRRALSVVLSVLMIMSVMTIGVVSASAATVEAEQTLYLKPNSNWLVDGARFAAYFFVGEKNEWVSMTDSDSDGYYEVVVPEGGYTEVIFCRMDGASTDNNWNTKWNQTADLTMDAEYDCYTVKENTWDNGGGTWSKFGTDPVPDPEPQPEKYYLVGEAFGNWVETDEYEMTAGEDGSYTITLENLEAGTYEYKVKTNTGIWYPDGANNLSFTVEEGQVITVAISADKVVTATGGTTPDPGEVNYYVVGDMNGWNATDDYKMTAGEDGSYTFTTTSLVAGTYIFKVNNGKWASDGGEEYPEGYEANATVVVENDGDEITFVLSAEKEVYAIGGKEETEPTKPADCDYYIAGTMNGWNPCDENYKMVEDGEGIYKYTIDEVTLDENGQAKFKVTIGNWDFSYPQGAENDYDITDAAGKTVVITYDEATDDVTADYQRDPEKTFREGTTLYLTPNANWTSKDARFAAYFCNDDASDWLDMADEDGDGVYEVVVPADYYEKVIFCRMDPANPENDWGNGAMWTQTDDLTPDENGLTCYVIEESAENWKVGAWSEYTLPQEPTEPVVLPKDYTLVGTINGIDVGCNEDANNYNPAYNFVDGKVTVALTEASYVYVKLADNSKEYMTDGWQGEEVTSVTLWDKTLLAPEGWNDRTPDKLYVPAGLVEFTLDVTDVEKGTITLSYEVKEPYETESTQPTVEEPSQYTLIGYINGADVGFNEDWETVVDEYTFETDKITVTFTEDSYVFIKTTNNKNWFMFDAECRETTGTLKNTETGAQEKMFVPAGTVTFTLVENEDGTLALSYVAEVKPSESTPSESDEPTTPSDPTPSDPTPSDPTPSESQNPSEEHTHNYTLTVTKEATCKEEGIKTYTCDCGDSYTEAIPVLEHTEVTVAGKAPTCTETGLTEGTKCSACDETIVAQEIIPALGHNYTSEITKQPTCTENGVKTYTCDCGDSYTEVIKATGHKHTSKVTKKATCKAEGVMTYTCACGNTYTKKIAKAAHVTTKSTKKATYFADGYKNRVTCKVCKKVISKGTTLKKLKLKTPKAKYTAGKKKLTVKYTKVSGATGFQVKYKIGKKTVTKTYNTKKSVSKTIKSLKKGTYKVYVRAMVKSGSKKAYSSWTKAKTVKVKG